MDSADLEKRLTVLQDTEVIKKLKADRIEVSGNAARGRWSSGLSSG